MAATSSSWEHTIGKACASGSGSVAYQVIRRASCPVLVVKEPELNRKLTGSEGTALHPHVLLEKQR